MGFLLNELLDADCFAEGDSVVIRNQDGLALTAVVGGAVPRNDVQAFHAELTRGARGLRSVRSLRPLGRNSSKKESQMRKKIMTRLAIIVAVSAWLMLWPAHAEAKVVNPKASCLAALTAADQLDDVSEEFADNVADYFAAVSASAKANASGSVTAIIAFLNDSTAAVEELSNETAALTARARPLRSAYAAAASKCRAGR